MEQLVHRQHSVRGAVHRPDRHGAGWGPGAAPRMLRGVGLSVGIEWVVVVAAERLVGGTGIGYFVGNEWNNLSIANILCAVLFIGLIGMALDVALARLGRAVSYRE